MDDYDKWAKIKGVSREQLMAEDAMTYLEYMFKNALEAHNTTMNVAKKRTPPRARSIVEAMRGVPKRKPPREATHWETKEFQEEAAIEDLLNSIPRR